MLRHHHGRQKENENDLFSREAQAGKGITGHAAGDELGDRDTCRDDDAIEEEAHKIDALEHSRVIIKPERAWDHRRWQLEEFMWLPEGERDRPNQGQEHYERAGD